MRICCSIALIFALCSTTLLAQETQPAVGCDMATGATYELKPSNGQPPPKEWIDKDTGHRVLRLSDEPNSQSLYFNIPSYSPDGKKMAFFSLTGIYQIDLQTRAIEQILPAISTVDNVKMRNNMIQVGLKTGHIFITRTVVTNADAQNPGGNVTQDRGSAERSVWWVDPETKAEHRIGTLPPNHNVSTVNCDETMLAGAVTYLDGRGGAPKAPVRAAPGQQHQPQCPLEPASAHGTADPKRPNRRADHV